MIDNYLPPSALTKNCGSKKLILDPFCESGTTILVAAENNVKVFITMVADISLLPDKN